MACRIITFALPQTPTFYFIAKLSWVCQGGKEGIAAEAKTGKQ
jgi:hypothetical protein